MERMMELEEMLRELSKKYKNSKSVEVYEEDLEGWFKIIDDLEKENKELKAKINKVIELFNEGDSSDLYDYIDDLDYYETEVELDDMGII